VLNAVSQEMQSQGGELSRASLGWTRGNREGYVAAVVVVVVAMARSREGRESLARRCAEIARRVRLKSAGRRRIVSLCDRRGNATDDMCKMAGESGNEIDCAVTSSGGGY
jgi:hypothetical protein